MPHEAFFFCSCCCLYVIFFENKIKNAYGWIINNNITKRKQSNKHCEEGGWRRWWDGEIVYKTIEFSCEQIVHHLWHCQIIRLEVKSSVFYVQWMENKIKIRFYYQKCQALRWHKVFPFDIVFFLFLLFHEFFFHFPERKFLFHFIFSFVED